MGGDSDHWGACVPGPKDDLEESGWKMVSGDVFRAPPHALLLCMQLGSGVQIIISGFITLFFAALGTPGWAVGTSMRAVLSAMR